MSVAGPRLHMPSRVHFSHLPPRLAEPATLSLINVHSLRGGTIVFFLYPFFFFFFFFKKPPPGGLMAGIQLRHLHTEQDGKSIGKKNIALYPRAPDLMKVVKEVAMTGWVSLSHL